MEDIIDVVKTCHTVDQLNNHHAHLAATLKEHTKLMVDTLEYDPFHASDHRDKSKTSDPIRRHVQRASSSKPGSQKANAATRTGTSQSQDKSKKQQPKVPVRSQASTQRRRRRTHRTRARVRHKPLKALLGKAPCNPQTHSIPHSENSGDTTNDDHP